MTAATASEGPVDDGREEWLVRGYAGRLLVAVSAGWLAIQCGRLVLSPMLPAISSDLGISGAQAGFAFTTLWGLYAVLQLPSGRLSDVLSRKTLLVAGLGLSGVGFTAVASASSYALLLVGAAVLGTGAGLYPTVARALVSDLYTAKQGRAFGLHTASGDVGGVASAGLAAAVLSYATWRAAFVPVVVAVVAVLVALHLWSREEYVVEGQSLEIWGTVGRLLVTSQFRWLLVAYTLYAFTWQATAAFLPTFLETSKEFAPIVGQVAFGVLFDVGAVVKPTAGWLSDSVSRRALTVGTLVLGAIALVGVVFAGSPTAAVVAVAVFAVGLLTFPPVMQSYLIGVGALGPTYVGTTATLANYDLAFYGLVAALLAAAGIVACVT